jgi:TonB family protein
MVDETRAGCRGHPQFAVAQQDLGKQTMSTQTIDSTDLNSAPTRRPGESPRQQSVCIEIPVSVHGSRTASGSLNNSQAAKPFLEETRTMIVFPSGAVLRLTESVSEGQILILKNARVKQEVACRVVSSKTNASAKGYVEVEFFQAAPGFWGITFPSASTSAPADPMPSAPEPRQTRVEPSAAKPAFFQPPAVPQTPVAARPVAPVAPVISRPAPAPTPVIPAARIPEVIPEITPEPVDAEELESAPVQEAPSVSAPFVSAPIVSAPIVSAPVASTPAPPVLSPDSTQELNAAIAAAYAAQVEPVKPIKKSEPVQEAKSPAPNKQLNPTKPKSAQPAKVSRETQSSPELLPMAESIGYPSSEFSAYGKSGSSAKQNRTSSSASSSSIENRKLDLTSSQIASEAVLGKPLFGAGDEVSKSEKSGSSRTWMIGVAAGLILALGAGGYWWYSHKLGASKSSTVSAAAPATTPSALPAVTAPSTPAPTGSTSQPSTNPGAANPAAGSKAGSASAGAGNSLVAKSDKASEPVNAHRPTVLPSAKIAAPVSHTSSSSIAAPDVTTNSSSAPGGSLSAILPGMGQPSSAPAPPPSRPAGPPPVASTLQQPKLIQSDSPVYPKMAATRGDWGDVIIDATVGENGKVVDTKVISGPDTLRQSALQVVRTQTYQPAKLNGKAVSMHVMVKVPFPKPR